MNYLVEALTLGILYGLGPCTIVCAPILVPLIISTSKNGREGILQIFIFGFGRILSYISLGILSGYAGHLFGLSIKFIGIFIIVLGISILLRYPKKCLFPPKIGGGHLSFLSGVVIGLGPCPPLLALLSLAALTRSAFTGGLMGFVFGLGSFITPLIILGFLAGKWTEKSKDLKRTNTIVCSLFLILLGSWRVSEV
jgi:thiol:disulfide interchange protein DsbD